MTEVEEIKWNFGDIKITSPGVPKLIGKCPDDPITAKRATNEMINAASNFKKHHKSVIYLQQLLNIVTNNQMHVSIYLHT